MTAILPQQMALENPGTVLPVTGRIQICARKVHMDVQVECRPVQTQQAARWIYAMELMTTATLPVPMAQKTHKTEHHVMGLIQTSVKKVRKAARVVHSCVQTTQAIQ